METTAEQIFAKNLSDLSSCDTITVAASLVFFDEYARRFHFGYKPQTELEHNLVSTVSRHRFVAAEAIRAIAETEFAKGVWLRFSGRMGISTPNEIRESLESTDEIAVLLPLLDSIGERNSFMMEKSLRMLQENFTDNEVWIWSTFALVTRGLDHSLMDELAVRTLKMTTGHIKIAQIAFRLAWMGNKIASEFCMAQDSHVFDIHLSFETICWYECDLKNWRTYLKRHCSL